MSSKESKDHTVPIAYLNGFSEERRGRKYKVLQVFDKQNQSYLNNISPQAIMKEGGFYNWINPDGTIDKGLETYLANEVESGIHTIISEISKNWTAYKNYHTKILHFLSWLAVRTVGFRGRTEFVQEFVSKHQEELRSDAKSYLFEEMFKRGIILSPDQMEENSQLALEPLNREVEDVNYHISAMGRFQQQWFSKLSKMNIHLFHDPNHRFITSDNPIPRFYNLNDESIYEGFIPVPLSSKLAIVFHKKGSKLANYPLTSDEAIKDINEAAILHAERFVAGKSMKALEPFLPTTPQN